jgi:hypothetical protein
MNILGFPLNRAAIFHMPEHGGDSVKGGGHPSDETVSAEEEIRDAFGQMTPQRRGMPGTNDPGVPGSRTHMGQGKPMEDESARAHPHPGPQTGEGGTGSGGSDKGGETDKRRS